MISIAFACYCLISIIRIILYFLIPEPNPDYLKAGTLDSLYLISYQILSYLLTYGIILMVNSRLLGDISLQEEKFSKAFHSSPYAILLTRLDDGTIIEANKGFEAMSGYTAAESTGKSTLGLGLWQREEDRAAVVNDLSICGSVRHHEMQFRRRSGEEFTGIFSADIITVNNRPCVLSIILDITERKRDEERIRMLLAEKELILKEVHHRIKNNMSVIKSLLQLQADSSGPEAAASLAIAATRIQSMLVLYDRLYRSSTDTTVSLADYFPSLIDSIIALFPNSMSITKVLRLEDIKLDGKILSPLGIIVNELLTNAVKHAFVGKNGGIISLSGSQHDGRVTLLFEDDGIGIPDHITVENSTGFGMLLIGILVKQIHGTIAIQRRPGEGTAFRIDFPVPGSESTARLPGLSISAGNQ